MARSLIVSGTRQKTLPGPHEPCIIQRACLEKKEREREIGGGARAEEKRKRRREQPVGKAGA